MYLRVVLIQKSAKSKNVNVQKDRYVELRERFNSVQFSIISHIVCIIPKYCFETNLLIASGFQLTTVPSVTADRTVDN